VGASVCVAGPSAPCAGGCGVGFRPLSVGQPHWGPAALLIPRMGGRGARGGIGPGRQLRTAPNEAVLHGAWVVGGTTRVWGGVNRRRCGGWGARWPGPPVSLLWSRCSPSTSPCRTASRHRCVSCPRSRSQTNQTADWSGLARVLPSISPCRTASRHSCANRPRSRSETNQTADCSGLARIPPSTSPCRTASRHSCANRPRSRSETHPKHPWPDQTRCAPSTSPCRTG